MAIRAALGNEVGELPAYTTLREEHQLSGEEIGAALGWAIRTFVRRCRLR